MDGTLSSLSTEAFYARAAKYRIGSYHNLERDPDRWRAWISNQGPVLVRVVVDRTWDRAAGADGELDRYRPDSSRGGHAVCLVGYTRTHFIVRNSWGSGGGTAALRTRRTPMPRAPSTKRTARCSDRGHALVAVTPPQSSPCRIAYAGAVAAGSRFIREAP